MNLRDIEFFGWEMSGLVETVGDPTEVANWADRFLVKVRQNYPSIAKEIDDKVAASMQQGGEAEGAEAEKLATDGEDVTDQARELSDTAKDAARAQQQGGIQS